MNKLNAARILMITTIAVIVAFQFYWLRSLYKQGYDSLRRSSDIVFKESIYQLQVSRVQGDSLLAGLPPADLFSKDMVRVLRINKDSNIHKPLKGAVFVAMNTTSQHIGDSVITKDSVNKIVFNGTAGPAEASKALKFTYRFTDSLPIRSIDSAYHAGLLKAKITLPFIILKIETDAPDSCPGDFCTSRVPVGLFGQTCYVASFSQPTKYLLKEISPQVLLSFFVVVLTVLSFVFIYRNLLEHKRLGDIKNEFISNITHELKTPIATVTVAIEAMKNFNALQNPERTREYLDIADNELQRLSLLVDKVLKLSMFEQEQLELKFENVDLKQLTTEIIASMRIQFEKRKAVVSLNAPSDTYTLQGDRLHLTSMIYNLLDNAIKYSPDKPVIDVAISDDGEKVKLQVKDNGVGISSEYRDKIFDKFFRVPGGNRHNVKGYGLGLSYVSHIVQKHHGKISVESEPGVGTLFIIDLPKINGKS